ncbi:MAG: hypothetical protein ABR902_12910 [Candidatus Korobacteraceae bacterium]
MRQFTEASSLKGRWSFLTNPDRALTPTLKQVTPFGLNHGP